MSRGEKEGGGRAYCSTSTGNGLVVSKPLAFLLASRVPSKAKGQVVAVALRRSAGFKGLEDDVRHSLTLEDSRAGPGRAGPGVSFGMQGDQREKDQRQRMEVERQGS